MDELAAHLLAYRATGVEHITLNAFPWELKTIERLGPVVEALRVATESMAAPSARVDGPR